MVAAPNTAKEVGLAAEKTVAKPLEPLIVVAFGNDTVVLLIEAVPVVAPKPKAVAAVKALTVVDVPVSMLNVAAVEVKSPPLIARSPCIVMLPLVAFINIEVAVPPVLTV